MITVSYTLYDTDGDSQDREVRSEHVPRIGDLVAFDVYDCYEVTEVVWQMTPREQQRVMVSAFFANWHERHARERDRRFPDAAS